MVEVGDELLDLGVECVGGELVSGVEDDSKEREDFEIVLVEVRLEDGVDLDHEFVEEGREFLVGLVVEGSEELEVGVVFLVGEVGGGLVLVEEREHLRVVFDRRLVLAEVVDIVLSP
jgi:hypothetical protein